MRFQPLTRRISLVPAIVAGSALPSQTGTAIYQSGMWKVGDKSFCALLVLELGKSGVPSACMTAG